MNLLMELIRAGYSVQFDHDDGSPFFILTLRTRSATNKGYEVKGSVAFLPRVGVRDRTEQMLELMRHQIRDQMLGDSLCQRKQS